MGETEAFFHRVREGVGKFSQRLGGNSDLVTQHTQQLLGYDHVLRQVQERPQKIEVDEQQRRNEDLHFRTEVVARYKTLSSEAEGLRGKMGEYEKLLSQMHNENLSFRHQTHPLKEQLKTGGGGGSHPGLFLILHLPGTMGGYPDPAP